MMNGKKLKYNSVIIAAVPLLIAFITGLCVIGFAALCIYDHFASDSSKDEKKIKDFIASQNLQAIEYDRIEKKNDSTYFINFNFIRNIKTKEYDQTKSIEEGFETFEKMLKFISDNDLFLNEKQISFIIKRGNDLPDGKITLANYYDKQFDYGKIICVRILDNKSYFNSVKTYAENIQSLCIEGCYSLEEGDMSEFLSNFYSLKEVKIYHCKYSNKENFPSEKELAEIRKIIPYVELDI